MAIETNNSAIIGDVMPAKTRSIRERLGRWYELPQQRSDILAMAGMRGMAVLLVFCVHVHDNLGFLLSDGSWLKQVSYGLGQIGHAGVDIFFLLSGYLIYSAAIRPNLDLGRFWLRRVERIYPAFFAVFAIYVLLSLSMPGSSKLPDNATDLAGNLLLLAGLFPFPPVITVTWSLSFEIFYYLTIPLLIIATGMRTWSPGKRKVFFISIVILFCVLFYGPLYRPGYWTTARMIMFVAGILLYEQLSNQTPKGKKGTGRGSDILVATIFIAALILFFWLYELGKLVDHSRMATVIIVLAKVAVLAVATYLLCAHCFTRSAKLHQLFEWTPLRWLGNMSYSYYLIHALAIHATAKVIHMLHPNDQQDTLLFLLVVPFAFAVSIGLATALFLLVERPLSLVKKIRVTNTPD